MEGKLEGKLETLRNVALLQLNARFGPLATSVQQRVQESNIEQLEDLVARIVKVNDLKELRLED